jgi:hypothetical protein
MRFYQLVESRLAGKPKMGRDLNHIEDLVFFYGSDGAAEVIDILRDMTGDTTHDISIKWDGKVALFYGRDSDGRFGLGTKGNWAKNTPARSAQEIHDYIMTSGKGESFRPPMAKDLQTIFPYLEESVPSGFRGFVTGDLIFSPTLSPKQKSAKGIQVTPNQVTYTVTANSEMGKLFNQAVCGMALHIRFDEWKGTRSAAIDSNTVAQLRSKEVLTLGQTYAPHAPRLDPGAIKRLEAMANKSGPLVDAVIEKRAGLSDVSNIIYTFNNQTMRGGGSDISVNTFFKWLGSSSTSLPKQEKIKAMHEQNPTAFPALFELFNAVQQAKNNIIDQLDSNETDIQSSTNGERGGEGYVSLKHNVKLVPRTKWRPS